MLSKQIEFYNNLTDTQKYIVHLAAIVSSEISYNHLCRHLPANKKPLEKLIKKTLEACTNENILIKAHSNQSYFNLEFLVWLFPSIPMHDMQMEWKGISAEYIPFYFQSILILRDYLYALLFDKKQLPGQELKFRPYIDDFLLTLAPLFTRPEYEPVLHLINPSFLEKIVGRMVKDTVENLNNLSTFAERDTFNEYYTIPFWKALFIGDFDNGLKLLHPETSSYSSFFTEASRQLLKENNPALAMSFFDKGMKKQRGTVKNTQIPLQAEYALYFMIALQAQPSEVAAPMIQKIIDSLTKREYTRTDGCFKLICQYLQNNRNVVRQNSTRLQQMISYPDKQYYNLWAIIALYFIGEKPQEQMQEEALHIVKKAYDNDYLIQALEGAYALNQWWGENPVINRLYGKIKEQLAYEPALSRMERQEDWKKDLTMLLGLGGKKAAESADNEKEKYRVAYCLSPKSLQIQPILQTFQKNGKWSGGKNIALKSLYEGKAKGMTEQDYRIAKQMHRAYGYYDNSYEFNDNAIKELIGHPYLFLNGSDNIPIELIEGKPIVNVVKNNKGYRLVCNLEDVDSCFFILKETNTRYLVYNLTESQLQILKNLKEQNITVPEQGKDLLMKVLSHLSTQLTVYSDLVSTDTENVRKIAPDSRIRVQLLPFGNGLKAELFTKPFGDIPPYCKPGWGGKVLISSQKGEQWQTVRNLKQEKEQANVLYSEIQQLESIEINDGLIAFDNPLDSLYLLDILQKHQDIAIVEWPEGEKYRIKKQVDFENLQLKVTTSTDWFELQGELKVDEETVLTISQLLALTRKGHNNFVELNNGDFLLLSDKLRKRLNELDSFAHETKKGIQLNKFAAFSASDFFDEFEHLKTDNAWKDFKKKIEQADQIEVPIPSNLQAELRPYQEEGFHWMMKLSEWGAGACLADDMGLGKTIQALTILLHRSHLGPAMVICPVSVLPNWINETCKFAPSLNIKTLSANNREKTIQSLEAGDLLITSYGLLQSEDKLFSDVVWASLVLDEAHTIKNYTTKTSKAAMLLQASFKLALTGTPIQNHLGEIWNLFNFINPGLLGSLQHFTDNFVKRETDTARKHLKKLISPFILRRTKTAVLDELPPKTEIIKKIQFSNEEAAFYEALRRQALLSLEQDTGDSNGAKHLKALVEITRLRQACCNPALVNRDIHIPSSKLAAFIEIATDLRANKHRALVFSQFVTHLSLVKKELDRQNITYQYLDGSFSWAERENIVKRFQSGESDLFLISLKAGGLGLNLTAADFVIHLDPWWNPAVEDQASDRAHRIGQTRPVT
ncbi:RNA polymerase-associated protein RapA, partial [termite gut metagenome]